METINVTIAPKQVIEHVALKLNNAMELPLGDIAGPQPSAEHLAAVAIDALADFGLLDGSYFAVVKHAREVLPEFE